MTLPADALVTLLNTNWATGTGGTKPTIANLDAYTTVDPNPYRADAIFVWLPQPQEKRRVNDKYADVTQRLQVISETKTSSARNKEIGDEIQRIINNHLISGVSSQYAEAVEITTDRREPIFRTELSIVLKIFMEATT